MVPTVEVEEGSSVEVIEGKTPVEKKSGDVAVHGGEGTGIEPVLVDVEMGTGAEPVLMDVEEVRTGDEPILEVER